MSGKHRARKDRSRHNKAVNRMTLLGITLVVASLAAAINLRGTSLKAKDLEYQVKEANLIRQVEEEQDRSEELEERRVFVQTKQYIEQVAKEKLGLVNPDEILLKPEK